METVLSTDEQSVPEPEEDHARLSGNKRSSGSKMQDAAKVSTEQNP